MARREIEGDFIMGWPDRKRPELNESTDGQGSVIGRPRLSWICKGLLLLQTCRSSPRSWTYPNPYIRTIGYFRLAAKWSVQSN